MFRPINVLALALILGGAFVAVNATASGGGLLDPSTAFCTTSLTPVAGSALCVGRSKPGWLPTFSVVSRPAKPVSTSHVRDGGATGSPVTGTRPTTPDSSEDAPPSSSQASAPPASQPAPPPPQQSTPTPRRHPRQSRSPPPPPPPAPPPGWPGPTNTGVPAGVQLTPSGSIVVTTPGTVIDARDVSGTIEIMPGANNVTIKRTRVRSGNNWPIRVNDGVSGTMIQDVEVDGLNSSSQQAAIGWSGMTVSRANVHNTPEGVRLSSNGTVSDSWIHDLCQACAGYHSQDIGNFGGSHNRIIHNNLSNPNSATAVIFFKSDMGSIDDNQVVGNLLDGGNYTIYSVSGGNGTPTNVLIQNNRFGRTYVYGISDLEGNPAWTGNVWNDTGAAAGP